jgi:hypothetical protein
MDSGVVIELVAMIEAASCKRIILLGDVRGCWFFLILLAFRRSNRSQNQKKQ